jgi:hypothetical protein
MKYFIIQHENQLGPYSIEDLGLAKIDKNTLVWYEGLLDWTKASELEELKDIFVSNAKIPPPIPESEKKAPPTPPNSSKSNNIPPQKNFISVSKKTNYLPYIGGAILLIFLICLAFRPNYSKNDSYSNAEDNLKNVSAEREFDESTNSNQNNSSNENSSSQDNLYSNNNSNYSPKVNKPQEKTEYELQEELKDKEEKKPLKYLNVDYKLEYKVFTGEDKITGNVYNTATVADFTNVEIEITYSNSFDVFLGSEIYYLDGIVNADNYTQFSTKVKSPSGTKKIGLKVISATKVSYD